MKQVNLSRITIIVSNIHSNRRDRQGRNSSSQINTLKIDTFLGQPIYQLKNHLTFLLINVYTSKHTKYFL